MSTPTQILFVRQKHDAKRAGLHYDFRVVIGDKAFSWATRKDFPEVGKPTILWEQPVHHKSYLDNPDITIPEGQYGAGTQVIDYAQKGNALVQNDAYHLELNNGDRFLIKKAPDSYGEKAWLFLRKKKLEDKKNPYLEKVAALGSSDMTSARSQVNKKREESGKSEIGYHEFKEQFKDRRGVSRRVVGTLGLANVGAILGRGNPGAALVGGVAGYYLGKSFDNKNARKNMVKEAAEENKRTKKTAAKEIVVGAYGLSHVAKAPSKLLGYHNLYHGTSKENAKSILKNGLNTSKGGSRGSKVTIGGEDALNNFVNTAKKHVYMTKQKMIGRTFAGDSAKHINTHGVNSVKGTIETLKDGFKNGKVLKARVPHNAWHKNFEMDPDSFPLGMRLTTPEDKLKNMAARSKHGVGSQFFAGGKGDRGVKGFATKKNLRRYYSTASGKARGKLGAFQLAAGAALTAGAAMHNKDNGGVLSKAK